MNQCLRCKRQCSVTSLFCDTCETLFQGQELPAPGASVHIDKDVSTLATSPHIAVSPVQDKGTSFDKDDDIAKHITAPNPGIRFPGISQPSAYSIQTNLVEQALHRLSDAARRLAAAEPDNQRKPKISRLSPLRDISADIQRKSTPLPAMPERKLFSIDDEQSEDLDGNLPDLWPWLNDGDSGEINAESWTNCTDPLISRRFPDSIEAARIEEEDMRRAAAEGMPTFALRIPRKHTSRLRVIFASLTILAILALTIDSILVSVAFLNKRPTQKPTSHSIGSPTLTLSTSEVIYGQVVTLYLHNFTPSSSVYVTRDMDVLVPLTIANRPLGSVIRVNSQGNADVLMNIESTWDPGFHTIEAEDQKTRYTAQTSLRIVQAGPTRPPHLVVDTQTIDLGNEAIGANSLRPLSMHNDGSGSITWSASSNQPWLLVAPDQGTFSDSQTITVAGQRANLKPGDDSGLITITSNIGTSATVPVNMTVLPLPPTGTPVLQVTPALLSFVAVDGSPNPNSQSLLVSNPGVQPLHWSVANQSPTTDGRGAFILASGISTNWLKTNVTKGTVAPHASTTIQVNAQSTNLLPGAYTSTLVFNADKGTVNDPQSVNVSLTVQPRCSLQVSTNMLTFTTVLNTSPATQAITLSGSSSCSGTSAWTATSSAPWLSVTPTDSQFKGATGATATVAVNVAHLTPNTYTSSITLTMASTQNTQSVTVQLIVQPPPAPGAPNMVVSPLNLNFSEMAGLPNAASQIVSITNTGGSILYWSLTETFTTPLIQPWLITVNPAKVTTVLPGQTVQIIAKVRTAISGKPLAAGMYSALIKINGQDANANIIEGSPQTVTVNMNVLVPCTLPAPTSNALAFTAPQGGSNPAPQTESFGATGNCAWPVNWNVSSSQSWLRVAPTAGSFTTDGQSASATIAPKITGMSPGTYTAQITIASTDSGGISPNGSPQTIPVTLTITGFTISGTVNACADSTCSTSVPLANAALTLTDGSGAHFTTTADVNGNYSFSGVALGSCTIAASGSNGTINYAGNATPNVIGDQSGIIVNAF